MKQTINKESRAELLFSQMPIKKAIWIVVLPSLILTLMIGLYSFVDQVFIQQFVPETKPVLSSNGVGEIANYLTISQASTSDYLNLFNNYNKLTYIENGMIKHLNLLGRITSNTIVSTTNAAFQPLIIFSNSIVFLIPVGASVYYTKCLSKKLDKATKNVWATMFWSTFTLSLIATMFSFIFVTSGIMQLFAGKTILEIDRAQSLGMSQTDLLRLQDYYDAAYKLSIQWANEYVYVYAAGTILQGLVTLFSYFIRAEGFNTYVMWIGIGANLINIALDAVFIIVFKMGVLGGVLATIIGWIFNLSACLIYTYLKSKQKHLQMNLGVLFKFKFNKDLLIPTILLGLSGFIRSFGVAFSFAMINIVLSKPSFADPIHFQFYWAKATPIITLFLISIFGISDGARSLLSYNYTRRDFQRCKEIYLWTLLVSVVYAVTVYIFVAITAGNLWVLALNVDENLIKDTANFIRILTLRIIATCFSVSSLLVFQGTNNIEKSILATSLENFITFLIIIPIGIGIAYGVYNSNLVKETANWIIIGTFIFNTLFASLILLSYSYYYITKKLPKIDQNKISWSRKIEHKFFATIEKENI
ncbi:MATE family efflux transporter [Mycoplasma sp. 744]|uniref:MATE family efflux transporter n=1 Tax=Mycoplasma sp. 744 TaxID=3108531 RepID=UPI002B1E3D68|nr:MATE family efflux transporter [Mycoplasma sp. 744]MEA4115360.1 MATE family efflux transporter [Mycoplasma sp. 744]